MELESCSPAQGTEESGVELGDGRIFVMVEELFPDVAAWFDALCFSYEVMSTKPEPRAFLATLERLNVTPEQCVFVDDAEQNVQGARAVVYRRGSLCLCAETRQFASAAATRLRPDRPR